MSDRSLRAILVASMVGVVLAACSNRPSQTIHDAGFVRQANALCADALPPLRATKKETDSFGSTPANDRAVTADKVEKVADGLDEVATKLGELRVRSEDQAEVAGWLEEWTNYTGIGRRYAAAVRTEKASVYTKIAAEGSESVQRIARFARGNHIDRCIL